MRHLLLISCLLLGAACTIASAADSAPPLSGHGVASTGHFPAAGIVTTFYDVPADYDFETIKKYKKRGQGIKPEQLPAGAKPGTSENVLWRTTLPHWGNNAPVVVGGKVFLLCNQGWESDAPLLVCIDDQDGTILWQEPVDHLDAEGVPAEAKPARAKEIQRYKEYMYWWHRAFRKDGGWANYDQATYDTIRAEADAAGWILPPDPKWNIGVGGGGRDRWGLSKKDVQPKDKSLIANFKKVTKEGWHRYQGWGTEAPWYGMTHGSVVSDGETIYAITGLGGAAAFSLDGTRKWVQWLRWPETPFQVSTRNMKQGEAGHNLASPALAGDTLVFYFFDAGAVFGLDIATGGIKWKTDLPTEPHTGKKKARTFKTGPKKGQPIPRMVRKGGHMGPGSTPVILTVSGEKLAVLGNGMVLRVADGKHLGWIPGRGRFYYTIAGEGDVVYLPDPGRDLSHELQAVRVKLDGDTLAHEVLWVTKPSGRGGKGTFRSEDPNLIIDDQRLYASNLALDRATGKVLASGPNHGKYQTGRASSARYLVQRLVGSTDFMVFQIVDKETMQIAGRGLLCEPEAEGEIRDRHIAFLGFEEIGFGNVSLSAWGNRLYLRSNDYLWCIGSK